MQPNVLIKLVDVKKQFKNKEVLHQINFMLEKGQLHGLIGPNGSGKTTMIKSLLNVLNINDGKVYIAEQIKGKIGYVPEVANFKKGLTCQQYLIMVGLIKGMSYQAAKTRTWELLKELDLTAVAKKNPNKFSSGLKKKLLIANILFTDCDVIILDEPTDNLDPDMRLWIINLIKKLNTQGKTILICTHILSEVEELLDSLTIIKEGNILYSGMRPQLLNPSLEISLLDRTSENTFQNYVQQNNITYQKINDTYLVTLSEPQQTFLEKLYQLKIKPTKLKEHHETLYDLYNKYIK